MKKTALFTLKKLRQGLNCNRTGVKFKDACHVASAIFAHCDYLISTDKRLLKFRTDEISMVTPVEFILRTEGEEYASDKR